MKRRDFLRLGSLLATSFAVRGFSFELPQETAGSRLPIIDVHMHAYPAEMQFPAVLPNPATGVSPSLKNGEEHLQACLLEMKRWNVVKGITSGGDGDRLRAATHWHEVDPSRFIAAAGVRGSEDTPLPDIKVLRKGFGSQQLRVLGEVTAEYAGLNLSDSKYEPYLSLAEELDVPVALHTGMGPPGGSFDPCCRGFRARLGNPILIEEALNRHPKLRVNLMHAGWPYLQDTIAILFMYPQVYADLGALDWIAPRAEFHSYLGALVRAGFGKRIMFGSDCMYWPEAIGMAIEGIESANFLNSAEKRDIFYNNAARFYRLEGQQAAGAT
jgi:predicted TIM-barrel fold metal-dependent hydrolase